MKKSILYLFLVLNTCLSAQDLIEQQGYFRSPKAALDGIIYSDNFNSTIYYTSGQNSTALFSAPGCGRYFSISPDKRYIGFKLITENSFQQPALYDLKEMKITKLFEPVKYCGQVSFGNNIIAFSVGNEIILYENGIYKKIDVGTYSNITPISPDNNYIIYNDGDDQLWLLDLKNQTKVIITDKSVGYFNPQWSPDGMNIVYSSIGGFLKVYSVLLKNTIDIGSGYSPSWSEDGSRIIYFQKVIENMKLLNTDIYEYILPEKRSRRITFTQDICEMDPSYVRDQIIYQTQKLKEIKIMGPAGFKKSSIQENSIKTVPVSISYYSVQDQAASAIDMPYVHQVYDTPNWFNGHSACGATAAMNILAYYNILPVWETSCSSPKQHINNWGRYVAEKYNFKAISYNYSAADPNGKASWGGYGYTWNGSKSPYSSLVNYYKNHGLTASLSDSPPHSEAVNEIQNGFPYTLCVGLTSAGHIIAAHGLGSESHTLIVNDPYGNKNTPGYPSYDGKDAKYDWPGYNNGFQNLETVYWCVKNHGTFPVPQDSIIDDLDYANGFVLHTKSPSSMSVWKDLNRGFKGHMWFAKTRITGNEICYAEWKPQFKVEGKYEVSAFISLSNAEAAAYIINHKNGTDTIVVNQKTTSDDWLNLGSFWFTKGASNSIKLTDISTINDQELAFDAIRYKLIDSIFTSISTKEIDSYNFTLSQNYPNPFNPITTISFTLAGNSDNIPVLLSIFNTLGERVAVLVNENKQPGRYSVNFDASSYPGGVYYYALQSGNFRTTKKMLLLP